MISPEEFARALGLTVISGTRRQHGMRIRVADLCRPGLQFAGYFDVFASERPQLIGKTEMAYLNSLPPEVRDERLDRYFSYEMPCIVIARGMPCPPALLQQAVRHGVPIYGTLYETSAFTGMAIGYLSEALAPRQTCHGVLLDVFGVGVLITGESGIGKSECALELIKRGHQLVADDVVDISRVGSKLVGESPEMVRDFMELRGIGIVDIKSIFGIGAVLRRKTINIVIHLEIWSPDKDYDRLGTREQTTEILGVNLPLIEMPVRSGRNLAIIMEIAARNWRLKSEGYNAVAELDRRLAQRFSAQRDEEEE
ncbi:MAG: HPr(Ser) kinase/phosphatase [Candidatus Ventricola sp.]|nr:HPr(Ser) kinase/phosphatase [Candidatus Ventricola sp.]